MLITIDSLRYDVFENANLPFLKSFGWEKAYTHGTYTLPAHMAFFTGKLPCNYNRGIFDNLAIGHRNIQEKQQWRLANPEADRPCIFRLEGKNIIQGFNKLGFKTIGTGAVSWFNTTNPSYIPAINDFNAYKWFGEYTFAKDQIKFVLDHTKNAQKWFAFLNLGETHHPFKLKENEKGIHYGDKRCYEAQTRSVEYLDSILKEFFDKLDNVEAYICSDHGDCFGEDGLWGHSFYHEKVIEVPIIKIVK